MKCIILSASEKYDQKINGIYPSRVVLLFLVENKNTPFSTHIEIFPYDGANKGLPYVAHGEYYENIENAVLSFYGRMEEKKINADPSFKPVNEIINF